MDISSGLAVAFFAVLNVVQVFVAARERHEMRKDHAARIAVVEEDRRALTAAALQAPNPIAASAMRRDMRVANVVEANPVNIEGLS
jgi:hypothetical protein